MTKIILLDFWGTLVENGVWSPTKQVRNILGIRMPFPEYVVRMERSMMTKEFSSLKAFLYVFAIYTRQDYKFLQKAVDSYCVALYNSVFGFIRYVSKAIY